jgi:hypothetical protein
MLGNWNRQGHYVAKGLGLIFKATLSVVKSYCLVIVLINRLCCFSYLFSVAYCRPFYVLKGCGEGAHTCGKWSRGLMADTVLYPLNWMIEGVAGDGASCTCQSFGFELCYWLEITISKTFLLQMHSKTSLHWFHVHRFPASIVHFFWSL